MHKLIVHYDDIPDGEACVFPRPTVGEKNFPQEFIRARNREEHPHDVHTTNAAFAAFWPPEEVFLPNGRRLIDHPAWPKWHNRLSVGEFWTWIGASDWCNEPVTDADLTPASPSPESK